MPSPVVPDSPSTKTTGFLVSGLAEAWPFGLVSRRVMARVLRTSFYFAAIRAGVAEVSPSPGDIGEVCAYVRCGRSATMRLAIACADGSSCRASAEAIRSEEHTSELQSP